MGQIQGATTSATTYELSKTPITYDIPHREGVQQAANSSYPGADFPWTVTGRARQRDWAAEGVTWAEGHMGICRSHVSLSRGHLWLLPMLYVRFVQEPFRKVSGKRVRKVSGMSGFMKRCHGRHRMHGRRVAPPITEPFHGKVSIFTLL